MTPHRPQADVFDEAASTPKARIKRRAPAPMALEQRFMFDGAAVADAGHVLVDTKPQAVLPVDAPKDTSVVAKVADSAPAVADAPIKPPSGTHEILFVDPTVGNYQTLVANARAGVFVVVLNTTQDPWQQMTDVIAQCQDLTAVHVVSHGASGDVLFGEQAFGVQKMQAEASLLAGWKSHMAAGADLLVYGCDIGAGASGSALITSLSQLTGMDVAASTDATGAASQGGNWTLEAVTGPIESRIAFNDTVVRNYTELLTGTPQTLVVNTGINVDSTSSTTGLIGAGKSITFDPATLTMGATSNNMLITGYDVDYGMKDPATGTTYAIGNPGSEWDGVYIKKAGDADVTANWKFVGFLNGLNNTWITTTNFDVNSQLAAMGMTAGQSGSFNVRVVADDNGTQTQANNGGKWVVGASKLQFIIDGGANSTATLTANSLTGNNAAVSVKVTTSVTATYTVLFNLADSTGHLVAGYNTTLPFTAGTETTISGSMLANTTLYSSTAFSNIPNGTYTLQMSVLDANGVQQAATSTTETITSGAVVSSGSTSGTTAPATSTNRITIAGITPGSWTGTSQADVSHQATSDIVPVLTGSIYESSNTAPGNITVTMDGSALAGTVTVTSYISNTNRLGTWTFTPSSNIALGGHEFVAKYIRNTTTYLSGKYDLAIDGPIQPAITTLDSNVGGHTSTTLSPTFSGTATPLVTLYVYDGATLLGATSANSSGAWAFSEPSTSPLTNGAHSITVTDMTNASYGSRTSVSYAVNIASTAPTQTITNIQISNDTGSSATDFVTGAQQQNITATLSSVLTGNQKLKASLDGGLTWTDVTSAVSGTSIVWNSQLLRSGYADPSQFTPWAIQFEVSDGANTPQFGPVASVDYRYIGSLADPTITRTGWATASTPTVYGTADPNSVVTIRNGNTILGTATPDSTGKWSFTPSTPFADGSYTLTATSADPYSGATSAHSASITLSIDHTLPVITGIHISADTGSSATDFVTKTAGQTITATLSQSLNTTNNPQNLYGSVDGGATWTQVVPSGTSVNWTGVTLNGSSSIEFQARSVTAQGAIAVQDYVLDTTSPVLVASGNAVTYDSGAGEVTLVFNETGAGLDPSTVSTSTFVVKSGATTVAVSAVTVNPDTNTIVLTVAGTIDSLTYAGTTNVVKDLAGNAVAAFSKTGIIDTAADSTAPATPTIAIKSDAGVSDTGTSSTDAKTKNNTPTVQVSLPGTTGAGTAPVAGDVVNVYSNGLLVGQAIVNGTDVTNKYVTLTLSDLGSDGTKLLTATETDASGNVSNLSTPLSVVLDRTAPALTTAAVNGSTLTLYFDESGTGLANLLPAVGSFSVLRNGATADVVTGVVVDNLAQTVTLTLASAITSADTVSISYTAGSTKLQDVAGNLVNNFSAYSVVNNSPDVTATAAPTLTLNAVSDSGTSSSDAKTNVNGPSVRIALNGSGATAPVIGDTVKVYSGGSTLVGSVRLSTQDVTNGYVDITTSPLGADGTKNLTATITDAANNVSAASSALALVLDTTAPVISNATVNAASLVLTYTEAGSGFASVVPASSDFTVDVGGTTVAVTAVSINTSLRTVTLTLATAVTSSDSVSLSYTPGAQPIKDVAGNVAVGFASQVATNQTGMALPTETVVIASVADAVSPVIGAVSNGGTTNDTGPILSGSLSAGLTGSQALAVYRDGIRVGFATVSGTTWTYQESALVDGSRYAYTAQVEDGALTGTASNSYTITVDTTAPAAPVVTLTTDANNDGLISALERGAATTAAVRVALPNGTQVGDVINLTDGSTPQTHTVTSGDIGTGYWTAAVNLPAEGATLNVTATVTDAAGNTSGSGSDSAVLDTTAPVLPTVNSASTTVRQPTLSGTYAAADAAGGLRVTVDGRTYVLGVDAALTASGNTWSLNLAMAQVSLLPGAYDVLVRVSDAAGNQASNTPHGDLRIQSVPVVPVDSPATTPLVAQAPEQSAATIPPADSKPVADRQVVPNAGLLEDVRPQLAPRPIYAVYTVGDGNATRIPVIKNDTAAIFVLHGVPDQYFDSGNQISFRLPPDAFMHTKEDSVVRVYAERADGRPLPTWLHFNATAGVFDGQVPIDAPAEIEVRVMARDADGREASTTFRLKLRSGKVDKMSGRSGLSDQIRQTRLAVHSAPAMKRAA